jgi:hypothetical protein
LLRIGYAAKLRLRPGAPHRVSARSCALDFGRESLRRRLSERSGSCSCRTGWPCVRSARARCRRARRRRCTRSSSACACRPTCRGRGSRSPTRGCRTRSRWAARRAARPGRDHDHPAARQPRRLPARRRADDQPAPGRDPARLAAGTVIAGVVGTLLAVPLAAIAWTIISYLRPKPSATSDRSRGHPDQLPPIRDPAATFP